MSQRTPRPKGLKTLCASIAGTGCPRVLKMFFYLPTVFKENVVKPLSSVCADDLFTTLCDNLVDEVMRLISFPGPEERSRILFLKYILELFAGDVLPMLCEVVFF